MTCFDLPCGAVLRAQQVSWNKPERGKCRPPHHLRHTFNASYLPDLTKTAALRALKARHIKTRTSLVSLPLTFKELRRPNVSSCGLCFSHISEPGTHLKMLRVGGGRTGITLSECQHVDYCVLKTRIIHSFGHGYAVFWCNRSHRAPNWLWQPLQMCISQCLLAFFLPHLTWQEVSTLRIAWIWITLKWTPGNDYNCGNLGSLSNSHKRRDQ